MRYLDVFMRFFAGKNTDKAGHFIADVPLLLVIIFSFYIGTKVCHFVVQFIRVCVKKLCVWTGEHSAYIRLAGTLFRYN